MLFLMGVDVFAALLASARMALRTFSLDLLSVSFTEEQAALLSLVL